MKKLLVILTLIFVNARIGFAKLVNHIVEHNDRLLFTLGSIGTIGGNIISLNDAINTSSLIAGFIFLVLGVVERWQKIKANIKSKKNTPE